ncbi:hypothetical protein D9M72_394890 [compost metagenome]
MATTHIHAQKAHAATRGLFVCRSSCIPGPDPAGATVSSRNAGDNAAGAPKTVPPGYPQPK